MKGLTVFALFFTLFFLFSSSSSAFESDELLIDDEEFGLEGGVQPQLRTRSSTPSPTRKRYPDLDSDSRIQFSLDHAFGDSDFAPAGTFTARLKTSNHGGQVCFSVSHFFFPLMVCFHVCFWLFVVASVLFSKRQ